jgi:bacterioferritin
MKGDPRVLKALNDVLRKELTGINQYFMHSRMCRNWGYQVLDQFIFKESIEEMEHADQIINRILMLDGVPNVAGYDKIMVGKTVKGQLENDLGLEEGAIKVLHASIATCNETGDHVSRDLLEQILADEEGHVDWIEAQLHLMQEVGPQNYLAQQIYKDGGTAGEA